MISNTAMRVLCLGTLVGALMTSPVSAGQKVVVTEHPSGGYVASLVDNNNPADNETVGHYDTKKEARKAGKKAKNDSDFMHTGSECNNPTINC